MTNTIETFYAIMFKQFSDLQDKKIPIDIERVLATKDIGQVIINAAKVENDRIKLTGQPGTGFIPEKPVDRCTPELPSGVQTIPTQNGVKTISRRDDGFVVTRHKMAG